MKGFIKSVLDAIKRFFKRFSKKQYTAAAIILVLSILIIDVAFHLVSSISSDVETMPAKSGSFTEYITADAFIVRDEISVTADMTGNPRYYVDDGERVTVDDRLAGVYYYSSGRDTISSLAAYERALSLLSSAISQRPDKITSLVEMKIEGAEADIALAIQKNNLTAARAKEDELKALLLCREILENTIDTSSAIKNLEEKIAALELSLGEPVVNVASESFGWFYSFTDGYEGLVGNLDVDSMSFEELAQLFSLSPIEDSEEQEEAASGDSPDPDYKKPSVVGKIVENNRWYAVAVIDNSSARRLVRGKKYTALLDGVSLEITFEKAVYGSNTEEVAVILSSSEMPSTPISRISSLTLSLDSHEGIKVPTAAIVYNDGVSGVYIQRGFVVEFREISVIYREDSTVIVDTDPEVTSGKFKILSENDNIIVKGDDLYVGKITR